MTNDISYLWSTSEECSEPMIRDQAGKHINSVYVLTSLHI